MPSSLRDYLPPLALVILGLYGTWIEWTYHSLDYGPGAMLGAGLVMLWAVYRERSHP